MRVKVVQVFMQIALALMGLFCLVGLAIGFPLAATAGWILLLETSPDVWAAQFLGGQEAIDGGLKAAGLILVPVLGLRFGLRTDRYNPGLAFAAMFIAGLAHGLYPGLSLGSSLRSLLGSAAPFAFGFAKPPLRWSRGVIQAVIWGPVFTVIFGFALSLAGLGSVYDLEQGAMRLGGSGEPPFLGGFTLIAIYAGLMELTATNRRRTMVLLLVNSMILVLTGARAPLLLAAILTAGTFIAQRRIAALAAAGAALCLALIFSAQLGFIRVIGLVQLGEASDLSNRNLVWPYFTKAIAASPWIGWGTGAGKVVIPLDQAQQLMIGTNAAHDEYLRIGAEGGFFGATLLIGLIALWTLRGSRDLPPPQRWLIRCIMLAFAVHSATDNTLIATTSSVFFILISAIFASARSQATEPS